MAAAWPRSISRKCACKIPKGNMGYDQYTVCNDCSCRTYFLLLSFVLANIWRYAGASFTLDARDFSSAVSGFCQVFLVTRLRPKTPKIPAEREKSLWYPGYVSFFQISLKNSALKATHNYFRDCRVHIFRQPFLKKLYSCMWLHFIANL